MLKKLKNYLTRDSALNIELFKILGVGGTGISFAACIYCLVTMDPFSAAINGMAGFLAILLLHYVEKTGHYLAGYIIVDIAVFMVLFAVLFFTGSGMDGSMPYFFSFGLIFSFLMFEGKMLVIMEIALTVFYLTISIISIRFPWCVKVSASVLSMQSERLVGVFLPSFSMGLIFLLYIREYKKQKQIAEEANRAKSIFLANMSHEIRTPINAVLGFNEIIRRKSKDAEVKEYAGYIEQSGKRLLYVINEILDFSKLESEKEELVSETFSLRELAAELDSLMSVMSEKQSLDYNIDYDIDLQDSVKGDREKLVRILTNLLSNAFKYTREGSVTLRMKLLETREDGQKIYFAVEDTGIGIKMSEINNLFHSYERADLMKNRKIEGTGLGLAITEQLLHMLGSSVHVDSTYGKGSIFSFEILLQEGNSETSEEENERSSFTFTAPDAGILVVDDDEMNRRLMDSFLSTLAISADFAESGTECLNRLKKTGYDLILMDYMMPEMDGATAMEKIRRIEDKTGRHTPIVVLTADTVGNIEKELKDRGFDDYLSKPVDFTMLEKLLLKYLPRDLIIAEQTRKMSSISGEETEAYAEMLAGKGILLEEGLKLVDGDFDQYLRIAEFFVKNAESDMQKMQTAADKEDPEMLRITLHSLKGKAGSVGAEELRTAAEKLETRCRNSDLEYVICGMDLVFLLWKRCAEGLRLLIEKEISKNRSVINQEAEYPLTDYSYKDLMEELRKNLGYCEGKKAKITVEQIRKTEEGKEKTALLNEIVNRIYDMEFDAALEIVEKELASFR